MTPQPVRPEPHRQLKVRETTLDKLHALKTEFGFDSLDALLRHLGRVAQQQPDILRRGRA